MRPPRSRQAAAEPTAGPAADEGPSGTMRIAKAIARAGICSRRDAERMIEEGRVSVNGTLLTSPALNVGPGHKIVVDGKPLPQAEGVRLWRFHKPRGCVTTNKDPEGRPTVFEKLPEGMPRVISIGRLDFNSEGLLLLTNDGELARHLELPATGWLRRYRARAWGTVTLEQLEALGKGVMVDGVQYEPIEARLDREQGDNVWLTLGLREGKNREVRKVLGSLGLDVNRLIRVSFGPFQLQDLEPGAAKEIDRRVLRDQLGPGLAEKFGLTGRAPEPAVPERKTRPPLRGKPPRPMRDDRGKPAASAKRPVAKRPATKRPRAR